MNNYFAFLCIAKHKSAHLVSVENKNGFNIIVNIDDWQTQSAPYLNVSHGITERTDGILADGSLAAGSGLCYFYSGTMEESYIDRIKFCGRSIKLLELGNLVVYNRTFDTLMYSIEKNGRETARFNSLDKLERYLEKSLKHRKPLIIKRTYGAKRITS